MSAKTQSLALGGTLIFGIIVGVHSGQVPDTRFIKGPTIYKTHVVTETKEIKTPLPDSCFRAMHQSKTILRILGPEDRVSRSVGKINLAVQDLGGNSAYDRVSSANRAIVVIRAEEDRLGTASTNALEERSRLKTTLFLCRQDLKGS